MRTVIGWMAAMLASALLGAAVYQTVLSKPLPELDPTATVESVNRDPSPGPTLYRTEVRTVVEPTPTVTVDDEVLIVEQVVPVSSNPAPARSSAPKPTPQGTSERDDDGDDSEDDSDDESGDDRAEDRDDEQDDDEAEDRDDEPDDAEDSEDD